MTCSTCWFANGDGESAHCGRCRCCARAERAKGREEVLQCLRNFVAAQELEALALVGPARSSVLALLDILRALIDVEAQKP